MEGKVPVSYIGSLVSHYFGCKRPEVVIDASFLTDSAVVNFEDPVVVSTDPITGADEYFAQVCVHVNANDVRVAGAEPVAFVSTILLPVDFPSDKLQVIFQNFDAGLKFENAQLVGGHSEYTSAVSKPVVVGTMMGRKVRDFGKDKLAPGQYVFVAGNLGQEGKMLLKRSYSEDILKISIKPIMDAVFMVNSAVFAHDLTEGGLVAALWELVRETNLGIDAEYPEVMIDPEILQLSSSLGFSPFKLISSGAVLLVSDDRKEMELALTNAGIPNHCLGILKEGISAYLNGIPIVELDPEGPDALWSIIGKS
jgi:hydrogenase maturation factor